MKNKISSSTVFIFIILISLIAGVFGERLGRTIFKSDKINHPINILATTLDMVAKEANLMTPKMVGKTTRFDRASVGPSTQITFYYTDLDYNPITANKASYIENTHSQLKNNACNNKGIKANLEIGGTYVFTYSDTNSNVIVSIPVNHSYCGLLKVKISSNDGSQKPIVDSNKIDEALIGGFRTAARNLNRKAPYMLDGYTRFDSASVGPGARLNYHYTLINYGSILSDERTLEEKLHALTKANVCVNKEMKKSLQYGGIYSFIYSDNKGIKIAGFSIDGNDCGYELIYP